MQLFLNFVARSLLTAYSLAISLNFYFSYFGYSPIVWGKGSVLRDPCQLNAIYSVVCELCAAFPPDGATSATPSA